MAIEQQDSLIDRFVETLHGLERVSEHFAQVPRTEEAEKEIRSVFLGPNNCELPDNTVQSNMNYFCARYGAIIEQAEQNQQWQGRLNEARNGERPYATASQREFAKAPRTKGKMGQEIFGHRLFRRDVQRDENGTDYIVDPDKITDTRLRVLELLPKKKNGEKKERESRLAKLMRMISFIPLVKGAVDKLEPLRFEHEQNELKLNFFRLTRSPSGYVVGTQTLGQVEVDEDTDEEDAKEKNIFSTDLYGARRRITHIRESYVREVAKLAEIVEITEEVAAKIDQDWPNAKKDIPEIKEKLLELVDGLKHVKNKYKVGMRRRIERCIDVKFVRTVPAKYGWQEDGRRGVVRPEQTMTVYNPKAAVTSLRSLPVLAGKRKQDMVGISGRLASDEVRLNDYIASQEKLFSKFYNRVLAQHDEFAILRLDKPLEKSRIAKIKGNLHALASQCDPNSRTPYMKPFFEPHLAFAEKMYPHLVKAAELLDSDRRGAACEFTKAFLIAKMENFYVAVEEFYKNELPPAGDHEFTDILQKIEGLRELINRKEVTAYTEKTNGEESQVFLETPEYDKIWGGLYHLLNSLKWQAEKGRAAREGRRIYYQDSQPEHSLNEEEAELLIKEVLLKMKNRIKEMRFEDLVRRGREEETVSVTDDAE